MAIKLQGLHRLQGNITAHTTIVKASMGLHAKSYPQNDIRLHCFNREASRLQQLRRRQCSLTAHTTIVKASMGLHAKFYPQNDIRLHCFNREASRLQQLRRRQCSFTTPYYDSNRKHMKLYKPASNFRCYPGFKVASPHTMRDVRASLA